MNGELFITTTTTRTTTTTTESIIHRHNNNINNNNHIKQIDSSMIGIPTTNVIKKAIANLTAESYFLHSDHIVSLQSRAKIPEAVHKLVEFGISSAPVLDDTGRCIGLFDMSDVLEFVLQVFEETKPLGDNFMAQLEQSTRLCLEPCSTIVNLSKRDKYHPISLNSSLVEAIMLLDTHNLHRIPVVDVSGQITSLITQSGVLQWFASNMDKLGPVLKQKVQDINLGYKPVVMVSANSPAIDSFQLIKERGISSVAVVGNDKKIVSVVSTSDLKVVTSDPSLFSRLHLPILSYLALLYPQGNHLPVVCSVDDTIESVINTLVTKKIHRVYLVDSHDIPVQAQQPVGVITLRDVIHVLMREDESKAVF